MVVAIVRTTETYSTVHGRTDYFNQMFVAESHATIGFVPLLCDRSSIKWRTADEGVFSLLNYDLD
jgi:hypothetical protein